MNNRYYVDAKGFETDNRRYNAEDVLSFPNKNVNNSSCLVFTIMDFRKSFGVINPHLICMREAN